MLSTSTIPVLVVGAGPAGLFLALSLVQNGIKVRIIDKDDKFHVGSRGFGIQPRTFELMKILGVLPDVQKLATPVPTMRAYKLPGGTVPIKTWDLMEKIEEDPEKWSDRPFLSGTGLSQATLEGLIRTHLARYNTTVELGRELVAIDQDVDGVTATIAMHGGNGITKEIVRAQYLVGADGAKGSTRKLLGLTFQGETKDSDGMVLGDVTIKNLAPDYWHVWGKPSQFSILARPHTPSGDTFTIGVAGYNFDPTELAEPEKLTAFVKEETGRTDLQFGEFTWLSYFRPNIRMVNKFQEGRAFVVGDAAHVHSPTGGQGMNSSVQDSFNLGWKLAMVTKGLADASLLSSFNTERLPVISEMLRITTSLYSHGVKKSAEEEGKPSEHVKDNDKESGWFRWRNTALHMYGINYRWSNVVVEERVPSLLAEEDAKIYAYQGYEGTLQAGDRAPEAPGLISTLGAATSLYSIFSSSLHTVLIFAAESVLDDLEAIVKPIIAYPTTVVQTFVISHKPAPSNTEGMAVLVDQGNHAFEAYRVGNEDITFVIVRPDTFIGAIVLDQGGVARYFSNFLI